MSRFTVLPGRFTASIKDDFVVFVIGMRVNKLWKLHMPVMGLAAAAGAEHVPVGRRGEAARERLGSAAGI